MDSNLQILKMGEMLKGVYRLEGVLGVGPLCITYKAQNTNTGLRVAIKEFFAQDLAERNPDGVVVPRLGCEDQFFKAKHNFRRQCERYSKTLHMTLPHFLEAWDERGNVYAALTQPQNSSLRVWVAEGVFGTETDMRWLLSWVLYALEEFHVQGYVHGNLAPENIFFFSSEDVPILTNPQAVLGLEVGTQDTPLRPRDDLKALALLGLYMLGDKQKHKRFLSDQPPLHAVLQEFLVASAENHQMNAAQMRERLNAKVPPTPWY